MAFQHGKSSKLKLNGTELQTFLTNISFNPTKDASETTTMGDTSRDFLEGLRNCSIQLSGRWDPTATTGPDAVVWGGYNSTSLVSFIYNPTAATTFAAGSPGYTGSCWVTDFNIDDPFEDIVTWTATLQVSGNISRDTSGTY